MNRRAYMERAFYDYGPLCNELAGRAYAAWQGRKVDVYADAPPALYISADEYRAWTDELRAVCYPDADSPVERRIFNVAIRVADYA